MKPQMIFDLCTYLAMAGLTWGAHRLRQHRQELVDSLGPEDRTYWPDSPRDKKAVTFYERLHAEEIAGMRRRHKQKLQQEEGHQQEKMRGFDELVGAIKRWPWGKG